jgi:hypothetical protein
MPAYRHIARTAIRQLSARLANSFLQLPFIGADVFGQARLAKNSDPFPAAACKWNLYHSFQ